jgi:subtilisin
MPKIPDSENESVRDGVASKGGGATSGPRTEELPPPAASSGTAAAAVRTTDNLSARSGRGRYLITVRARQFSYSPVVQPFQLSLVEQMLRSSPDLEVIDTIGPKTITGVLADATADTPTVLVARMPEQKAAMLLQQSQGQLIVERDQALSLFDCQAPSLVLGTISAAAPAVRTVVTVLGKDNAPLKDAEVYLFGTLRSAAAVTDERGQASLSLAGDTPHSMRGLYVKPKADYWSYYQAYPDVRTDKPEVIGLRPLPDWPSLANFPKQEVFGWGQKAMRLDQLPPIFRGHRIKVALIDSGAATAHDDLRKIRFGVDLINKKSNIHTWNEDVIAHGSHGAGLLAGAENGWGIRGFAPEAEIHVCRLFPGGLVSQLIDALEYCIENQIDVVSLSLGGIQPSEALEQQINRAKRAGVACIVAAGNSGGPVQYPASSPNVLTVGAIGKLNEFPPESYHAQTITSQIDGDGFFSPAFSCYGLEVDVCAPGVAVISCVPPNNYAVMDGTSTAAQHIAGLAALVLAHHPAFQSAFKARGAERVDRLFDAIKLSSRRVATNDVRRIGFGLPDVLVALGLQSPATASAALESTGHNALFGTSATNPLAGLAAGIWAGNSLGQAAQSTGGLMSASTAFDGGITARMPGGVAQHPNETVAGGSFGMPPYGFGRQEW